MSTSLPHTPVSWEIKFKEEILLDHILAHLHIPSGSKILDLTCGSGETTEYLSIKGYEAIGIDVDMEKIRHGLLMYKNLSLYQHDMQDIFYVHFFHLALVLYTDEVFIRKPNENGYILKNIFTCLAPGGFLVLGLKTEGMASIQPLIDNVLGKDYPVEQISLIPASESKGTRLPNHLLIFKK